MTFTFHRPPSPKSLGAKLEAGLGGCCAHSGFVSQLRTPEFGKFQSYKGAASRPAQSLQRGAGGGGGERGREQQTNLPSVLRQMKIFIS